MGYSPWSHKGSDRTEHVCVCTHMLITHLLLNLLFPLPTNLLIVIILDSQSENSKLCHI